MKIENKLERLRNGDIFEDLIQAWKRLGRLVYNDAATDPESLERATGLLYMTHYLTAGATLAMELMTLTIQISIVGRIGHTPGELTLQTVCIRLHALEVIRLIAFSEIEALHINSTLRFILLILQMPQIT